MKTNFARLVQILGLLPHHPDKLTPQQLHERLAQSGQLAVDVGIRTIQRDLSDLATEYPSIECRNTRPTQWGWAKNALVPVLGEMNLSQALAFDLFEREFGIVLPDEIKSQLKPWLNQANETLKSAPHAHATRWAKKLIIGSDGPPLLPAKPMPATLAQVSKALFEDKQISARYRSARKNESMVYVLHPLGLVRNGLVTYLVATFDGYNDPRLLALHRVSNVKVLDEKVLAPLGFNLQRYVGDARLQFGTDEKIELILHMTDGASRHLYDTPLSTDQKIVPRADRENWVCVNATVNMSPKLVWWILGFGRQVQVASPDALVKKVEVLK